MSPRPPRAGGAGRGGCSAHAPPPSRAIWLRRFTPRPSPRWTRPRGFAAASGLYHSARRWGSASLFLCFPPPGFLSFPPAPRSPGLFHREAEDRVRGKDPALCGRRVVSHLSPPLAAPPRLLREWSAPPPQRPARRPPPPFAWRRPSGAEGPRPSPGPSAAGECSAPAANLPGLLLTHTRRGNVAGLQGRSFLSQPWGGAGGGPPWPAGSLPLRGLPPRSVGSLSLLAEPPGKGVLTTPLLSWGSVSARGPLKEGLGGCLFPHGGSVLLLQARGREVAGLPHHLRGSFLFLGWCVLPLHCLWGLFLPGS